MQSCTSSLIAYIWDDFVDFNPVTNRVYHQVDPVDESFVGISFNFFSLF